MRRIARPVAALLALLMVLLAVTLASAYVYLRQSLPKLEGEVPAPALKAAVDVVRDAYGIPHIFASTLADPAYGLGYVHARDRLWQMEMNRRIGSGPGQTGSGISHLA
jgi:penicillin amidase